MTCLMVQYDDRDRSLSAGGDVKQIATKNQLSDMIEVLLCPFNYTTLDS